MIGASTVVALHDSDSSQAKTIDEGYRDLVAQEARGKTSPTVREMLMADPHRWLNTLTFIQNEVQAQMIERDAELKAYRIECFRMADGKERYAEAEVQFLRWKSRTRYFLAAVQSRQQEVRPLAKIVKQHVAYDRLQEDVKSATRALIVHVHTLISLPDDDEPIPGELLDEIEAAYDQLPDWLKPS